MNFSPSDACALHTWQATAFETESSDDLNAVANAYRSLLLTLAAQGAAVNVRYTAGSRVCECIFPCHEPMTFRRKHKVADEYNHERDTTQCTDYAHMP